VNRYRAVARILFQPRQRGKPGVSGGEGRAPGHGVRGANLAKPPEAESFSVVGYAKVMKNLLQFY